MIIPEPDQAMQTRCPRCLGEQWAMTVLAFSDGKARCTVCGHYSEPMTYPQWYAALAAARRRKDSAA